MSQAASAIDRRAIQITRTREAAGSYGAGGLYTPGSVSTQTILAVVQPASGRQLMDLPEGVRSEARWLVWSRVDLRIDDVITYAGTAYRLVYLWPRAEGDFYRAAAQEVAS